jgi:cytochrome c biogenesis protein CcmG/thiol:disulfide interchange protein DsbE
VFKVLAVLVLLGAGALAAFMYREVLLPPSGHELAAGGMPTRLKDKRVPGFSLPGLVGPGFEARDLLTRKRPILIKFWGSWSPAVIQEYPVLMEMQASRIEMWAINFRDSRTKALEFLERNGNPFARVAFDAAGRVASDWRVGEVPATFLVDGEGIVRWYFAGPLTQAVVENEVRPLLERWAP